MLISIPDVLSATQARQCRDSLDRAEWIDGNATAGSQSALVKRNMQLAEGSPVAQQMGNALLDVLAATPLFISAALPLKIYPPLFNRYAGGQHFGAHVDNAIRPVRGTSVRVRTDLSATLFLAEPDEYEGGVLVVQDHYGTHEVKMPMGHMVLYPSGSLHHVTPVTRGVRVASFFWVQSLVRQDEDRAALFELDQTIQALSVERGQGDAQVLRLTALYHNLLRRWAET
ncbi:Fe2+-dependent dioxygenase [Zavarzinia sp. CC-PAN008]|uniref:Fe2+-dependent dioxygenase n=1 Tax=Zavarzinia sp. CC-PAN008 TaxID=3243332 RepID=UPI003F74628E